MNKYLMSQVLPQTLAFRLWSTSIIQKTKNIVFLIFLFILISCSFASAYGVTPSQNIVSYVPGTTVSGSFDIINTEDKDIEIVLLAQGELNASLSLSESSFNILSSEKSRKINYQILTPTGLKPGSHSAEILILELPSQIRTNSAFVGAVVGVIVKVIIDVPYPGKYIESSLAVSDNGEKIFNFVLPLVSKGELDVSRARAIIDIYTPLNEKVASLSTNEIAVPSRERKEVAATWDTSLVEVGRYRVVATLIYDEQTITLEKDFSVGNQQLVLKNVEVNDFSLGEIAKFELLLENTWSELISGAYIQMQVLNSAGDTIADFKSAAYDIPSLDNKLLVAFWDTEGVKKGSYPARALVKFGQQSLQHEFTLDVSDNQINVIGIGYVIKSAGKDSSSNSIVVILGVAVGVLILLNLVWFMIIRKKLKNNVK